MDSPNTVYAISMNWFRQWQSFIRTRSDPPGPIDNSNIVNQGQPETIKQGSDYAQISEELWLFFHRIYNGGPEVKLRTSKIGPLPTRSQSVTAITSTHFENLTITGADSVPEFFIPSLKPKKHTQTYDSSTVHIETEKEIVPVHEPKSYIAAEKEVMITEVAPSESVTLEMSNTTISDETLIEENESTLVRNEVNNSTDDVSVLETIPTEVKQRKNKRRVRDKCKRIKNKSDHSDNKSGNGDK